MRETRDTMSKSAVKVRSGRTGRLATGAIATALTLGGLGLATGVAGAADASLTGPGGMQPITDYANYPPAFPGGCPDGVNTLVGVQFDNGRGQTVNDLRQLGLVAGDVVTMSWSGFPAVCTGPDGAPLVSVGLVTNHSQTPDFDITKDEQLLPGWD